MLLLDKAKTKYIKRIQLNSFTVCILSSKMANLNKFQVTFIILTSSSIQDAHDGRAISVSRFDRQVRCEKLPVYTKN